MAGGAIAGIANPHVVAPLADHQSLPILEYVRRILHKYRRAQFRTEQQSVITDEGSLAADDAFSSPEIAERISRVRGEPRFVVSAHGLLQLGDDRLLFPQGCCRGETTGHGARGE